jgi:hypothetical protein
MESQIRKKVQSQLMKAGWQFEDILDEQLFREGDTSFLIDTILLCNFQPIAVIEIKKPSTSAINESAIIQARVSSEKIGAPFAFITNGEKIFQIASNQRGFDELEKFPSPSQLCSHYYIDAQKDNPLNFPPAHIPGKAPRYYQVKAVNRAIEGVLNGKKRMWISMAAGAGKTYVALQIAWKLIKSGRFERLLYLADRISVLEQVERLFSQMQWSVRKLKNEEEIEFAEVQLSTKDYFAKPNESTNLKKGFQDYYDLIMIDEVTHIIEGGEHILDYFPESVIIGFSSSPLPPSKLTEAFGQYIYRYSISDELATQQIQAPRGFKALNLDEISEIYPGIAAARLENISEASNQNVYYLVKGKDILPDGTIDPNELSKVDISGGRFIDKDSDTTSRYLIKPNDILVSSVTSGTDVKVGFVSKNIPDRTIFSNSVILIRVDPNLADPRETFSFLRSDSGQSILKIFATMQGSSFSRISVRSISQIPVFVPESHSDKSIEKDLGAVTRARQQLEDELLPSLIRLEKKSISKNLDKSQDIELIARKLEQIAHLLAPPDLSERILTDFPTPIALPFRRYHDARFNVYERVLRLRDIFESVGYFVYNLMLSDLMSRLNPNTFFIKDKGARRAYNGYSMSQRMDFVDAIISIAKSLNSQELFVPEFTNSPIVSQIKRLHEEFRNRISHSATATESQQRKLIADFEPLVLEMLADLDFVTKYRMARVTSFYFRFSSLQRRMELYHGVVPELDEQSISDASRLTQADRDHIVLIDPEDQVLDLYPLYQLLASEETRYETHLCFFKQRKRDEKRLEGESVHGSFPVNLEGFEYFENLQSIILSEPKAEED